MHNILDHKYQRQIQLKEFGAEAQLRLQHSKVLVVGAGGLGCPALQYIAAAGIGELGIADADRIDITNLHRQILFGESDIGKLKAHVAAEKLRVINPDLIITPYPYYIDNQNALDIFNRYDVIIDGTDRFDSRYMINDAARLLGKPLVYGSVYKFEGQVAVFNLPDENGMIVNYRDLFPIPPEPETVPGCDETGVIGVLTGMIGTLQASEAIKIISGKGLPLVNRLFHFNMSDNSSYTLNIDSHPDAVINGPLTEEEFKQYPYAVFCHTETDEKEIEASTAESLLQLKKSVIIDVRNPNEKPELPFKEVIRLPMNRLESSIPELQQYDNIILVCQSGIRSYKALHILKDRLKHTNLFSLKGGINHMISAKNNQ